jgi:hypothetical protein
MLTGTTLLNKVNEMQAQNPPAKMSEIVRACGYELEGKLKYTQFYTELLTVKGLINNDTLENDISEENQDLYSELCNRYGSDAIDAFLELYDENDLGNFEDAYQGRYNSEAAFAEEITTDCYGLNVPSFVIIDWQATWDQGLYYDYDFVDGFVFSKNW